MIAEPAPSVSKIQCLRRGFLAHRAVKHFRHMRAALLLQCAVRRFKARRTLQRRRQDLAATAVQGIVRGKLARTLFMRRKREHCAQKLQTWYKGQLQCRYVRSATRIVLWLRRWLAKRTLRARREHAVRSEVRLRGLTERIKLQR
jgi:hypothetical protein